MKHLDLNSTIGDWISERPHTYHVFESLRFDCREGRGKPLQQECWERQLTPQDVLRKLYSDVEPDQKDGKSIYDRPIGLMETVSGG
jgi:hypothetical protein